MNLERDRFFGKSEPNSSRLCVDNSPRLLPCFECPERSHNQETNVHCSLTIYRTLDLEIFKKAKPTLSFVHSFREEPAASTLLYLFHLFNVHTINQNCNRSASGNVQIQDTFSTRNQTWSDYLKCSWFVICKKNSLANVCVIQSPWKMLLEGKMLSISSYLDKSRIFILY